jgi:Na/Pi-cotransporter
MSTVQAFFAALAAVILFLYGLQGFARELQAVGGEALKDWLGRVTTSRLRGFLLGATATAVVQSSSAITSLAVTLVDATVISFRASLGIVLGANVGTTATAWLVSLKLTGIGPVFIVTGALVSALPIRASVGGKAAFYFGLIFLALDLVSNELGPLRENPAFAGWLALAEAPWRGVLIGAVLTAMVQSSSVTTGVGILLVQQGVLPAEAAIPIVMGANIGSTATALIVSLGMTAVARATAVVNFLFNAVGVLFYYPFLDTFSRLVTDAVAGPAMAVAWAHLLFNLTVALLFLSTLGWLEPPLQRYLAPAGESGQRRESRPQL